MTEKRIKTWRERCEAHTANHSGVVSGYTIRLLMQEEIDDLRAALGERSRRRQARRIAELEGDNARLMVALRALQTELAKPRGQWPTVVYTEAA